MISIIKYLNESQSWERHASQNIRARTQIPSSVIDTKMLKSRMDVRNRSGGLYTTSLGFRSPMNLSKGANTSSN